MRLSLPIRLIVCLTGFAPLLAAQGKGVLGQDDGEFARLLFQEGYPDLAEQLCQVITANNPDSVTALEVQALGFELDLFAARREQDPTRREAALRALIEAENAFLKENARTRVAESVRSSLPNVYIELATTLTATLSLETDMTRRAERLQGAQGVFAEAKQSLAKRRDDFAQRIADGAETEYNVRQHMSASFNLARMEYQNALLFPPDSPERKDMLERSLDAFADFGLEYGESLPYYRGIIFQGLCHESLGKTDDALVDYQDAIALREQFVPDEKGVFQVGPEEADVISGATRNLLSLLNRLKRHREAVQIAADYLDKTPDPLLAESGPEILAAKAEAEIGTGDIAAAGTTAQQLVDLDPNGWSGRTGRELLGRLPIAGLAPDKILKIAETTAGRGDFARALDLCRQAREAVVGARDESDIGSNAFYMAGLFYRAQGRLYEASLAFDCAAELYPTGKLAPEALFSSVNAYRDLHRKERSRFYSARADARMQTLATKYAGHPRAAAAGIYQGQRKEDDGDFKGARDFYASVPKDSASYHEALFRLANATNLEAKGLLAQGKSSEAQALLSAAETQYRTAMETIQTAMADTLDPAVQQRQSGLIANCRLGLASLYIDTGKPDKVQEILEGLEKRINDPEVVAKIWGYRITALQLAGKVDEAISLFESVIQGGAAGGVQSAAGVLARALDTSAQELETKSPGGKRAQELWRKAASYYLLSLKGALEGTAPLRSEDVREVAQRLYVIGLAFNKVPEGLFTFVDWQGPVTDPELWDQAARIYERLDAQAPSTQVAIERARTLAILGRVQEAEGIYARLFDQVSLFPDEKSERFDRAAVEARPELVSAYLEWGVASHRVGVANKDEGLFTRAETIYKRSIANSTPTSRLWWQARYSQVLLLSDRGQYDLALDALENVKRNTDPKFDQGQFGFQGPFETMEGELRKKVFRK